MKKLFRIMAIVSICIFSLTTIAFADCGFCEDGVGYSWFGSSNSDRSSSSDDSGKTVTTDDSTSTTMSAAKSLQSLQPEDTPQQTINEEAQALLDVDNSVEKTVEIMDNNGRSASEITYALVSVEVEDENNPGQMRKLTNSEIRTALEENNISTEFLPSEATTATRQATTVDNNDPDATTEPTTTTTTDVQTDPDTGEVLSTTITKTTTSSTTDNNGNTTTTTIVDVEVRDSSGSTTSTSKTTRTTTNSEGQVITRQVQTTSMQTDETFGRTTTTSTDITYEYTYDSQDRISTVKTADNNTGDVTITEYIYDGNSTNVTQIVTKDINGNIQSRITYNYDSDGNQAGRTEFTYDDNGNLSKITIYDAQGQEIGSADIPAVSNANATNYSVNIYDNDGNVIAKYNYDADGNVTGHAEYEYDENNRMTESRHYEADGSQLDKRTYTWENAVNQTERRYEYRNGQWVETMRIHKSYDDDGNITHQTTYQGEQKVEEVRYTYTEVDSETVVETETYYNTDGTTVIFQGKYTYDTANQTVTIMWYDGDGVHKATTTTTWNDNGNTVSKTVCVSAYDDYQAGDVISDSATEYDGDNSITYTYDADGNISNITQNIVDDNRLLVTANYEPV